MNTKILTLFACCVLLLSACKSGSRQPLDIDDTQVNLDGVEKIGTGLYRITDRISEHSADLFAGSYDDSLLAKMLPEGKTPSAINVFLLTDGTHNWLFDTGLGTDNGGVMLAKLKALGIKPNQVDAIFLTHLHFDHIGGLVSNGEPVFQCATLYLSVDEFNAWSDDGPMAGQNESWKQVLSCYANQIQPFCDGDTLLGAVVAHLAKGHTPGHTVYEYANNLFVGDLFHAEDLQLCHPEFCARYDFDFPLAVASRKEWMQYAADSELVMRGAHLYDAGVAHDGDMINAGPDGSCYHWFQAIATPAR